MLVPGEYHYFLGGHPTCSRLRATSQPTSVSPRPLIKVRKGSLAVEYKSNFVPGLRIHWQSETINSKNEVLAVVVVVVVYL